MERIILAPGANGAELLKSLALQGLKCFNIRICSGIELARLALMRSGCHIKEEILGYEEEAAYVAKAASGIAYFGTLKYADLQQLTEALRTMRQLAGALTAGETEEKKLQQVLGKGTFQDKNQALLALYKAYMHLLKTENKIDGIGILRQALEQAKPLGISVEVIEEYATTPLQQALADHLSGGKAIPLKLSQLLQLTGKGIKLNSIKNCYGAANEVEVVIEDIYRTKQLDKCTVVVADTATYGQLFLDYALMYELPVTFGCGIAMGNSRPVQLLRLYSQWVDGDLYSSDALLELLHSEAFNWYKLADELQQLAPNYSRSTLEKLLKGLRLTNSLAENQQKLQDLKQALSFKEPLVNKQGKDGDSFQKELNTIPAMEYIAKWLAEPVEVLLKNYTNCRTPKGKAGSDLLALLDHAAQAQLLEKLAIIRKQSFPGSELANIVEALPQLAETRICRQNFEPGKLHITSLTGSLSALRDNLYIVGLGATKFPGRPVENYLLLDEDLHNFGTNVAKVTAEGKLQAKREMLEALVATATAAGAEINLSYSGQDVAELKLDNPSSILFDLYQQEQGGVATMDDFFKKAVKQIGYFDPAISKNTEIGKAYNQDKEFDISSAQSTTAFPPTPEALNREYSPSSLELFKKCPFKFWCKYILQLPEAEDPENLYQIMPAYEDGNLIHLLMEVLPEKCSPQAKWNKSDFLKLAGDCFDHQLLRQPTLLPSKIAKSRQEFLEMAEKAYDTDPNLEILLKEQSLHAVHPATGIKLEGFPDRVEKLPDGSFRIVDYKTSRSLHHNSEYLESCLQVLLYAYLLEQQPQGYRVSEMEYRYVRLGQVVRLAYDDEAKEAINSILEEFATALNTGSFSPTGVQDFCKYCKYGFLCDKQK